MPAHQNIQMKSRRTARWLPALCGAIVAMSLPAFAGKIKYTYDTAGRLTAAELGANGLATYAYDANGNLLNQTTVMPTNADVRIVKNTPTTSITVGVNLTYTLTITNAGPTAATGVTVTDPFPFGLLLSSANASQGTITFSNHTLTANLGILPANSGATITMLAFHGLTNTATNIAMVSAIQPDPDLANNASSDVTTGTGPINDSDGDGMPNWWESLNGLSIVSTNSPNGAPHDRDSDGVSNFDEWLADTRANDATSFFHIESAIVTGNVTTLEFESSAIRRYHAQFAPDMNTAFTNFLNFNGTGGTITINHTNSSGGFYRLRAELP